MFEISEGCDPLAPRSMYEKAEGFPKDSYHQFEFSNHLI
jgi:hypothetical protein